MPTYSLKELSRLADVTPRTIRFYIEQGLLPSPGQSGPSTRYTDEHFQLLRMIKKLQLAHFPLAEIRNRLRTLTSDQMSDIEDGSTPNQASDSAIDYIRRALGEPTGGRPPLPAAMAPNQTAFARPMSMPTLKEAAPQPSTAQNTSERSQWERIPLDQDIELHVRRPLTRHNSKRVERLITIARELFQED